MFGMEVFVKQEIAVDRETPVPDSVDGRTLIKGWLVGLQQNGVRRVLVPMEELHVGFRDPDATLA